VANNLLGKPLNCFIVNPADLPRKGVKRLATLGERVNHGLWVKMYKLCRVLKTVITATLMDTSGPKNSRNSCSLDDDVINDDNYNDDYYSCL
jgi:hypothetical protein